MKSIELDCPTARLCLSARLDGEPAHAPAGALEAHLACCEECRAHERALATLAGGFAALRAEAPVADLWPRIERAARERRSPARPRVNTALARVAALVLGFASLGAAALWIERRSAEVPLERHLVERLVLADPLTTPAALFAALPEYRLLRGLSAAEDVR